MLDDTVGLLSERKLVDGRDGEALPVIQIRQPFFRLDVQDVLRSGGRKSLASATPAGVVGHGLGECVRREECQSVAEALFDTERGAMIIRKAGGLLLEHILQRNDDALLYRHR